MLPPRTRTWTLAELVSEASGLLAAMNVAAGDARVASTPDARAVRYYQSLGIVERPLRYEGRRAIYGWRHLIAVLAIKLLQSQGFSLARIQNAFTAQPFDAWEAAVLQALGAEPSPPVEPVPAASSPTPSALSSFEVAPGVVLTIDPRLVDDPEGLARQVHTLLTRGVRP